MHGLNIKKIFVGLCSIPKYLFDLMGFFYLHRRINSLVKFKIKLSPVLIDFYTAAGSYKSEYFVQDLYVANWIFNLNSRKNIIDVGSRIDGFISNVASFSKIVVVDVREVEIPFDNISSLRLDFTREIPEKLKNSYDVVTSLHALEHFGLGRYSDTLDPNGFYKGIKNLSDLAKEDGDICISLPFGDDVVYFNERRTFKKETIIKVLKKLKLEVYKIKFLNSVGDFVQEIDKDTTLAIYFMKKRF